MPQQIARSEYVFMYIIGIIHAALHFTVGIIWENVDLPKGESALLSLPHFGGYLTLLGIALLLIFTYLCLSLKKEPLVPIHIRKFCLTLSIIITVGSLGLFVVMCIRTNDYRLQKDQIAKQAYYGAVLMTVVDILTTIFFMPSYIYLTICSYKRVQAMKHLSENCQNQEPNAPTTQRQMYIEQRASTDDPQHQIEQQPQPQQTITINDNIQANQQNGQKEASPSQPQTETCQKQTNSQNKWEGGGVV